MKYQYKTQEQLDAERPQLKEGAADFEIKKAVDKVSKSGNEMIELTVQVWDINGTSSSLFDYLVSSAAFKIKSLCEAIGRPDWYSETAEIDSQDLVGECGKCVLKLEKSSDPQYSDRMKIATYTKAQAKAEVAKPKAANQSEKDPFDDDIPF